MNNYPLYLCEKNAITVWIWAELIYVMIHDGDFDNIFNQWNK